MVGYDEHLSVVTAQSVTFFSTRDAGWLFPSWTSLKRPVVTHSYGYYQSRRPASPRFHGVLESEIPAFEVERLPEGAGSLEESTVDQGMKGRASLVNCRGGRQSVSKMRLTATAAKIHV